MELGSLTTTPSKFKPLQRCTTSYTILKKANKEVHNTSEQPIRTIYNIDLERFTHMKKRGRVPGMIIKK